MNRKRDEFDWRLASILREGWGMVKIEVARTLIGIAKKHVKPAPGGQT
jgi:hypothetical protein